MVKQYIGEKLNNMSCEYLLFSHFIKSMMEMRNLENWELIQMGLIIIH